MKANAFFIVTKLNKMVASYRVTDWRSYLKLILNPDGALIKLMLLTTKGKTQVIEQLKICIEQLQELWGVNNDAGVLFS